MHFADIPILNCVPYDVKCTENLFYNTAIRVLNMFLSDKFYLTQLLLDKNITCNKPCVFIFQITGEKFILHMYTTM